jgi:ABC-2 type transport system permease protein
MNRLLNNKSWWIVLVIAFAAVIYLSSFFHYRADLTQEKRFSLSRSTKDLLENLDSTITVQVFLTGDLSADYRKLSIATEEMLDEFKDYAGSNLRVKFERPGKDIKEDSVKMMLFDSLGKLGVPFERTGITVEQDKDLADQFIIPAALVSYGNRKPFVIDLRSSKTVFKPYDIVNQSPEVDVENTRNAAEALLEFKFANAIDKLTRKKIPVIAYLVGNREPIDRRINDLGENLRNEYQLGVFNLKLSYPDPSQIDALIIVKPDTAFTDEDKLKLDQYVMHGGKVIWFVDKLFAEYDSLSRAEKKEFVAFDRNLNLDDLLFKYGVRINGDLLQDLNCSKVPIVYDYNPDGSPKMQRHPFPYYPFLAGNTENPISKNLDRVLSFFPSTIDTVKAPGIKKTILLTSDTTSRTLASPALVALESVRTEEDFQSFNKAYLPVAVLLEGSFSSLYANRVSQQVKDLVQKESGKPFAATSAPTKQIVVSDADIVTNYVSQTNGPLPMGMIPFEDYRFANREFFLNCVDYLVSNSSIFESRNKEFSLRLLDKAKVESDRNKWQMVNIGLPVVVVLLAGLLLQWLRKRKYAG